MDDLAELVRQVSKTLTRGLARTERVVERQVARRVLGLWRTPRLVTQAWVWRLGAVLVEAPGPVASPHPPTHPTLSPDSASAVGRLWLTGEVIRVGAPRAQGYVSELSRRRADLGELARRSGIAAGETLNLDPVPVEVSGDPTRIAQASDGVLSPGHLGWQILWAPGASMEFERYLREHTELLLHPPGSANQDGD